MEMLQGNSLCSYLKVALIYSFMKLDKQNMEQVLYGVEGSTSGRERRWGNDMGG
jgi:hypothetical protein